MKKINLFKNMTAAIAALFIVMFALPQTAQALPKAAYVVKSTNGSTLTFYYDAHRVLRRGTIYTRVRDKISMQTVPIALSFPHAQATPLACCQRSSRL